MSPAPSVLCILSQLMPSFLVLLLMIAVQFCHGRPVPVHNLYGSQHYARLGSCVSLDVKDVQATSLVGIGKFPPTLYSAVVSLTFLFVTLSSQEMPRVLCCRLWCAACSCFITLCTKLSGTVHCNWSCVFVCLFVVCYHDNLKLCASICTKLGL